MVGSVLFCLIVGSLGLAALFSGYRVYRTGQLLGWSNCWFRERIVRANEPYVFWIELVSRVLVGIFAVAVALAVFSKR